jgi:hypothetical protein
VQAAGKGKAGEWQSKGSGQSVVHAAAAAAAALLLLLQLLLLLNLC